MHTQCLANSSHATAFVHASNLDFSVTFISGCYKSFTPTQMPHHFCNCYSTLWTISIVLNTDSIYCIGDAALIH